MLPDLSSSDLLFILQGALTTLELTFWAVLFGTILGLGVGWSRTVLPRWADAPLGFVLDVLRSVPLLIQLILANAAKGMFRVPTSTFTLCCFVLALYTMAFLSEIVRGAVLAVPSTTRRAARSLGMSYRQDLSEVVFPIALRVGLPGWIGLVLSVLKDTSLALWLGVTELLHASQDLVVRIQEPLQILIVTGLIYFLMSFPIGRLGARLEQRWANQ